MKKTISLLLFSVSTIALSQSSKVGVTTATPTENFDINGTARIRSLPNNGATNSIYTTGTNTSSGTTPTQTFNATSPVVADANGVLGKNTAGELVNNNTATGFTATNLNNSTANFVVRRYTLVDTAGGTAGTFNPNTTGFNTGMDVTVWQAIMSNVMYTINSANGSSPFVSGSPFNYRLRSAGTGNWRIVGDIVNTTETAVIDVLFIKSKFVAADARTN